MLLVVVVGAPARSRTRIVEEQRFAKREAKKYLLSLILQSSRNSSTGEKKMEGERRQQQLLLAGGDEEEISDVLLQDLEDGGRYETWEMQEDWEVEESLQVLSYSPPLLHASTSSSSSFCLIPCFALHFIRISMRCCSTSLFSCAQDLVCTVVERREEEVAGRLFTPGDYAMSSNLGDIIIIIIIADSIPLSDDHSVFHSFITREYVSTIVLQELVVHMYG